MTLDARRSQTLLGRISRLSESQISAIEGIVTQFERSFDFARNPDSDLVSECVLREFGDTLRVHHCFSAEAFTKDKFEFALVRVCTLCGTRGELAARGNRGHDVTIGAVRFSLKTQADRNLHEDSIHISKFMELGRGRWRDDPKDLAGLRNSFLEHMRSYDRILTLRYFRGRPEHRYELVEIPKKLLAEAAHGRFEMMLDSAQFPKPGTCTVFDAGGMEKFQLYFDGGTERKLQVRRIRKDLCIVHATWGFAKDATIEAAGTL